MNSKLLFSECSRLVWILESMTRINSGWISVCGLYCNVVLLKMLFCEHAENLQLDSSVVVNFLIKEKQNASWHLALHTGCKWKNEPWASSQLQCCDISFSPWRSGLNPRAVYVEFVADKVAPGHAFLRAFWFSPLIVIPPMLQIQIPSSNTEASILAV